MFEVDEAAKIISTAADADANIIFGASVDETMSDQVKITVIATGFDESKIKTREFMADLPTEPLASSPEASIDEEDGFDIPAFLRNK